MKMSRIEGIMRLVLAFSEAFNRHDVAGMMQLLNDNCTFESGRPAPEGRAYVGKAAIQQYWQDYFRAFPQAQIEIEEIFGLGMRCVMRWRCEWEAESGSKESLRGIDVFQVKQGRISEQFAYVKG